MEKAKKTPFAFSWADEVEREEREQHGTSRQAPVEGMQGPSKRPNPFGEARPREVVLEEKGVDWRKVDCHLSGGGDLRKERENAPPVANAQMEKHKNIMLHQRDNSRTHKKLPPSDYAFGEKRMHEETGFVPPPLKYYPKNSMPVVGELQGHNRLHTIEESLNRFVYPQMLDVENERFHYDGYVTTSHNLTSRQADCWSLPDSRTREYFHPYVEDVTKEREFLLHERRRCLAEYEEIHLTRRRMLADRNASPDFHEFSCDQRYDNSKRLHFLPEYEDWYSRSGVGEMKSRTGHGGQGGAIFSTRTIAGNNQRAKLNHNDSTRTAPQKERTNRSRPYSSIEDNAYNACRGEQHRRRGMPSGQIPVPVERRYRKRR